MVLVHQQTVLILLSVTLLLLLLETALIFLPSVHKVNKTLKGSMESETNARTMAREIGALYTSLDRSYEKISHINRPVENPRLYARAGSEESRVGKECVSPCRSRGSQCH